MAISNAWTDPDTLEFSATKARSADLNAMLGNQKYLHGRPRFTLAHPTSLTAPAGTDFTMTFDTEIEDVGGWYDPGAPALAVVPETGLYLITINILWDGVIGGTQRKVRLARDGDLVRGDSAPAVAFAEHSLTILSSMTAGQALSVQVYHDDSAVDHEVLSRSTPAWRSPLFMGVWMAPYSTDI